VEEKPLIDSEEEVKQTEKGSDLYIGCPRFGGKRLAIACAHFDRFAACRRNCQPLSTAISTFEDFETAVKNAYENTGRRIYGPSKKSCRHLPNQKYRCPKCDFVAKSERGLKSHTTRTHTP
jgi:predicted RNA-binding Zn-ribbon protein involved in translation (DUF1610 family)